MSIRYLTVVLKGCICVHLTVALSRVGFASWRDASLIHK